MSAMKINRRWLKRTLFALLGGVSSAAHAGAERVEFAGAVYHLYRVDKAEMAALDQFWLGDDGKPLKDFAGLTRQVEKQEKKVVFATNAGIFGHGPKPLGITVSGGRELTPLNLSSGEGNFYLKPNGVFFVDDKLGAGVMKAEEFAAAGIKPRVAVQSGPLLLRHGVMHPAFNENSPNRRLRSGVGVRAKDGQVIFAMSDREDRDKGRVTFYQFSKFFEHLGCADALFLDGDISDMLINPPPGMKFTPNTFAGMFVITK
jgi:uncharacterized protein YigE (DUF2233 family)